MDDEVTIKQIPLEFFREKQAAPERRRGSVRVEDPHFSVLRWCCGAVKRRRARTSDQAVENGTNTTTTAATLEKRTDWSESDLIGRPRGGFESL